MSVENEQVIPVQVRYIEVQSATVKRNKKIPSLPPKTPEAPCQQNGQATMVQNNVCQSPVSPESIEVMSPCAGSPTNPLTPNKFQFDPNLTYAEKVAHEMIVTEKIYLDNLKQIIDGFLGPVANDSDLDVSKESIDDLFINVEEIYQFNWVLLQDMEKCNFDPVKLAKCFVVNEIGFDIYTKYCTHYPRSMEVLLEWNQREDTANFIKKQQESLGHTLPLCSFLLKPVQRILKYHLLLGNIAKHYKQSEDEGGYKIIQKALSAMTNVAKHINDMKRKHEDALHLQEIQSVLMDYEGPNLTSFGSIVLEDTFRIHGTKTGRYLLLFEKALLITKRRSDGTFSWKATVMYSNMMLADSVFREPLTFQVIPFDDRKICYTFVSRDLDTKQVWLLELKRRLLDSYAAAVPMKAKQIILGNGREENEKENTEPESVRRSATRRGENQQRQLGKENSSQSSKLNKNLDSDRRKSKEPEDTSEEKTKTSIDAIKSPLRRKLRVFKKRKINKLSGKSSKRVSWSSDDNNDEAYKDRLTVNKQSEDQERKVSDNEPYEENAEEEKDIGKKYLDKNDNEVSISSLLREGETMLSVTGEVDNHLSGHVKLRSSQEDVRASKKRRLSKEKREKCKSMPVGQFPVILEGCPTPNIDKNETGLTRTHSLSRLYEKFLENELIDSPTDIKELQKYGLVNLADKTTKTSRSGSYQEELLSEEGVIHGSCDVVQTENLIPKTGESVQQTMKRVSMAFSDISPNFSPEKSPESSTEDVTCDDVTEDLTTGDLTTEDFTTGDLTPDEYTGGDSTPEDLTPDEYAAGDLSPAECGTGSPIPDELFNTGDMPLGESNAGEAAPQTASCGENNGFVTDKKVLSGYDEYKTGNGVNTDWNQNGTTDDQDTMYDEQSNQDTFSAIYSEQSSYVDTLSDSSGDEQDDESWNNSLDGSYQRVFRLKRSYSEENLISKYPFDEASSETGAEPEVTSKSYPHFDHASSTHHTPVMRCKSADYSKRPQTRPFTFSVTPKKKIFIKDSLWQTIKEDAEKNDHEIFVASDHNTLRRRRRRKSSHKKNKKNKIHSDEGPKQDTQQHIVRTCAVLNMADYRNPRNKESDKSRNSGDAKPPRTKTGGDGKNIFVSDTEENVKNGKNMEGNGLNNVASSSTETEDRNSDGNDAHKVSNNDSRAKITLDSRKKTSKGEREKSMVHVDDNMSEIPATINYLCIEAFPPDHSASADEAPETGTRDVKRTNGNTASSVSKVERLSKYFSEVNVEKDTGKYVNKQADILRKGSSSIKKRVEELTRRESEFQRKNSEEKLFLGNELHSLQNIHDRIGVLKLSTSEENQPSSKSRIELTSSLNHDKPNVQQLRDKIQDIDSNPAQNSSENANGKRASTSLRIRDRIQELGQNPDKPKADKNVDDDLRTCKRLKERIERLQKGARRDSVDNERDITISDDKEMSYSPRQNEELRTVVIKRGWVQQFIQRIETGS
ncbi:uncharacterized protein LOC114517514 [Dendronephthya gigantea]|uniref:uncharacterized protein LOC114517514 n=1 Tax=Dendronephthya gigantea TaxID=151771 RepID=UPI00106AA4CF|nr:uncharacterized protein LOC114517514 [Dendronephthya gigantea]